MSVLTLRINDGLQCHEVAVPAGATLLEGIQAAGISLPTLCHLDGLSPVGACRLCLVAVDGAPRLLPACITPAAEGMVVTTQTSELQEFRRMAVELIFAEGNHCCAVCVAHGHCELQDLAIAVGMDHNRFRQQAPQRSVDASHPLFALDHHRCILCSRCIRVCEEIEGVHVWDIAQRGSQCRLVAGLDQPWGEVDACTSCGKCVAVCPTGALFARQDCTAEKQPQPGLPQRLHQARQHRPRPPC